MKKFLMGGIVLAVLPLFFIFSPVGVVEASTASGGFVNCEGTSCSFCNLVDMANIIIKWLFGVMFLIFAVIMVTAGVGLITSAGDTVALDNAKSKFKNAIIGIIIVMAAWLLVDTIMRGLVGGGTMVDKDGNPVPAGEVTGWGPWMEVQCQEHAVALAYEPPDENDDSTVGLGDYTSEPVPESPDGQLCYVGGGSGQVCFPAYTIPNEYPYNYPSGMLKPDRFVKYSEVTAEKISKHYSFCDLTKCGSSARTGEYVYLQPNAVQAMDEVTDLLGVNKLQINSGFRSPAYNKKIGGAAQSTHMRGIAFDIAAIGGLTTAQIESACKKAGARWTRQYATFTHCDWR